MEELLDKLADLVADKVAAKMRKDEEGLVTRKDAVAMLHVTEATLWRWEQEGKLHPRKIGRRVYYLKSELYGNL